MRLGKFGKAVYTLRHFVGSGGLISYTVDLWPTMIRTMDDVDNILRGAKPADLPVEQPTAFELAFNARTARAIGYKLPPELQLRVDRVIE